MRTCKPTLFRSGSVLIVTTVWLAVGCGSDDGGGPTPQNDAWTRVAAGTAHTCGVQDDGSLWCWGDNTYGQLGDRAWTGGSRPQWVQLPTAATDVTAGTFHSCAVTLDGAVWCWGRNHYGQLGDGTAVVRERPVRVTLPGLAVSVAAGYAHTCAVGAGGQAWCWGLNDTGQLGIGNTVPSCGNPAVSCALSPESVESLSGVVGLSTGGGELGSHSCANTDDNAVWCWGNNSEEQLGDGTFISRNAPVEVTVLVNVTQVSAGWRHSCGRRGNGNVYCWGRDFGEPFPILDLENATSVTAGGDFTCALLSDGTAHCWGTNDLGQLGDGTYDDAVYPSQVTGVLGVVHLAAGSAHACAVTDTGQLWCWGNNNAGQLSGTSQLNTNLPTRVTN